MEQIEVNGKVYKQQMRNCGKACCKGSNGGVHGPYWYVSRPGQPIKYVGVSLPAGVRDYLERLKAASDQIAELMTIEQAEEASLKEQLAECQRRIWLFARLRRGQTVTSDEVEKVGLLSLLPMP